MRPRSLPCLNANAQGTSNARSEEQRPMTRMQLPLALLGLLLTMLASCSSPPGRNQQAAIHNRDGVPCFGVPDTKETRANPPLITAISVTEIGRGSEPVWERVFLRPGSTEPALHPNQGLTYGQDGEPAPAPPLRSGKRYRGPCLQRLLSNGGSERKGYRARRIGLFDRAVCRATACSDGRQIAKAPQRELHETTTSMDAVSSAVADDGHRFSAPWPLPASNDSGPRWHAMLRRSRHARGTFRPASDRGHYRDGGGFGEHANLGAHLPARRNYRARAGSRSVYRLRFGGNARRPLAHGRALSSGNLG